MQSQYLREHCDGVVPELASQRPLLHHIDSDGVGLRQVGILALPYLGGQVLIVKQDVVLLVQL